MDESKKWWQSRGLWGGLIAALAALAGLFGWTIPADDVAGLTDHLVEIAGVSGAIVAIIGRVIATKRIGS